MYSFIFYLFFKFYESYKFFLKFYFYERGVWGRMDTYICMAESLHCSPEIMTTLLIGYIPIQNVFGVKKNKNKVRYIDSSLLTPRCYTFRTCCFLLKSGSE